MVEAFGQCLLGNQAEARGCPWLRLFRLECFLHSARTALLHRDASPTLRTHPRDPTPPSSAQPCLYHPSLHTLCFLISNMEKRAPA